MSEHRGRVRAYELDVTDQGFRFPQTWRTNVGLDRRLPWGLVGTVDYIYNRDLNAPVYINANLPAADTAYAGVDNRPRWAAIPASIASRWPRARATWSSTSARATSSATRRCTAGTSSR